MSKDVGQSLYTGSGTGVILDIGGKQIGARGLSEKDSGKDFPVQHASFDLVIMNPPFTRPTNHEAANAAVPVPSFAGFGTSDDEQTAMAQKLNQQRKLFGHGNAGLASEFMDLAHDKLKPGGILAMVLPFSFVSGKSWENARSSLTQLYKNIHVVSIATTGSTSRAFSADTGMAECLVLAKKSHKPIATDSCETIKYVNLIQRPRSLIEAHQLAKQIRDGVAIEGSFLDSGLAGLRDSDIGRFMTQLRSGKLNLPRIPGSIAIPVTHMENLAVRGLLSRDINGKGGRGAFDIFKGKGNASVQSYPALWNHNAQNERRLIVNPDSFGIPLSNNEEKAKIAWQTTASRLHYNVDFRLNSQSLAACLTEEASIGGTAWPNLRPRDSTFEIPLLLWSNTTLGLMLFWWFGTRQQEGRARLPISTWPDILTLDVRKMNQLQLHEFDSIFKNFQSRDFLPANEAYRDTARQELDKEVLTILGVSDRAMEAFDLLRNKWCSEPSVHGGKSTRP